MHEIAYFTLTFGLNAQPIGNGTPRQSEPIHFYDTFFHWHIRLFILRMKCKLNGLWPCTQRKYHSAAIRTHWIKKQNALIWIPFIHVNSSNILQFILFTVNIFIFSADAVFADVRIPSQPVRPVYLR